MLAAFGSDRRWGPAFCTSAFYWESFNGCLSKFIHGSKNQAQELINNIKLSLGVQVLKARVGSKRLRRETKFEFRSKFSSSILDRKDKMLLSEANLDLPVKVFGRAEIEKDVYTSLIYGRQKKRNNFSICFIRKSGGDKEYGEIKCFCESSTGVQTALVRPFQIEHLKMFTHNASMVVVTHIIPIKVTNELVLIPIENISFKVIRVGDFVCLRPNTIEVNL